MEVFLGFIGGLITSWIFWKYLHFLKPNVRVSQVISKSPSYDEERRGQTIYRIKVVNLGTRQVINLSAQATLTKIVNVADGQRRMIRKIELKSDSQAALGPRIAIKDMWRIPPMWVVVVEPNSPLEDLVNDHWKLQLTLSAQDALSGTTVVQRVTYDKQQIVQGDFRSGLSLDVFDPTQYGTQIEPGEEEEFEPIRSKSTIARKTHQPNNSLGAD
jgi:hypothetical protein